MSLHTQIREAFKFGSLDKTLACHPDHENELKAELEPLNFRGVEVIASRLVPKDKIFVIDRAYLNDLPYPGEASG